MTDKPDTWLTWADCEEVVEEAFHVWPPDFPERRWGAQAWWQVTKETARDGDLNHPVSVVRFLVLCEVYLDFCKLAWGVERLAFYDDWALRLGLDKLALKNESFDCWLCGETEETWWKWEGADYRERVEMWMNHEREAVNFALRENGGGSIGVLKSLWLSAPLEQQHIFSPSLSSARSPRVQIGDIECEEQNVPAIRATLDWINNGFSKALPSR